MAGKKIEYVVDVDYSDLKQLGKAFTDAGRDAKQSFTGLEGALAKANADVNGLETELQGLTAAFNAVKAVSGDAFPDDAIVAYIQDLGRMGASMDEIVADADRVQQSLKRATDVNMGATVDGAAQVADSVKRIGGEADQSRSVLANMAGNSTQSLTALGGVTGDVGMALGQLAEYASEGNISLSGLASVAGPMAALAGATALVASGMADAAKVKAFDTERAQQFTDVLREGGDVMGSLRDTVAETGQLLTSQSGMFGGDFFGNVDDLIPKLEKVGLSFAQFQRMLTDDAPLQALIDWRESIADTDPGLASDLLQIINGVGDYRNAINGSIETQQRLNEFLQITPGMVRDSAAAFRESQEAAEGAGLPWANLITYLREGGTVGQATADAFEQIAAATGMAEPDIWAEAQRRLNEELAASVAAADDAAAAIFRHAAAAKQAETAVGRLTATMASADYDAAGIQAAGDALQEWFQATAAGGGQGVQQMRDYAEAFQNLGTVLGTDLSDSDFAKLILGTGDTAEARENLDALEQFGTSIMPRITQAFDESDGSLESFQDNVADLSDSIHGDLVRQFIALGDSEEEANDKANALQQRFGLFPENVETMYQLLGDADATAKLQLIQGYIDALPANVQTEVAMHILADDPRAALNVVTNYLSSHPQNVKVGLNTAQAQNDYAQLQAILTRTVHVPVRLTAVNSLSTALSGDKRSAPPTDVGGMPAVAATSTSVVAPAVSVPYWSAPTVTVPLVRPINVTVSAAVVGDRYDVQRVVARAVRAAERLNGART